MFNLGWFISKVFCPFLLPPNVLFFIKQSRKVYSFSLSVSLSHPISSSSFFPFINVSEWTQLIIFPLYLSKFPFQNYESLNNVWLAVRSKILVEGTDHGVTEHSPQGPPLGGDLESGGLRLIHAYILSLAYKSHHNCHVVARGSHNT